MSTDTVTLFLALLALAAQAFVALALVALVGGRATAGLRAWLVATVGPSALPFALVVAAVSMGGSLYFSEVAHFLPCNLCWYQRVAMYPLVPILAVAVLRRRTDVRGYVLPLVGIGACVSIYHVLVERFPRIESDVCNPIIPCTVVWVRRFGYLTIPTMALSAFALIATTLVLGRAWERTEPAPEELT